MPAIWQDMTMASSNSALSAVSQNVSAAPLQSEEKTFWPSDLMNLNDAEMAKLFDPGQQNGLLESYYQDMQGMVTSSSSLPLANESLEALIQDLDELSQPEVADVAEIPLLPDSTVFLKEKNVTCNIEPFTNSSLPNNAYISGNILPPYNLVGCSSETNDVVTIEACKAMSAPVLIKTCPLPTLSILATNETTLPLVYNHENRDAEVVSKVAFAGTSEEAQWQGNPDSRSTKSPLKEEVCEDDGGAHLLCKYEHSCENTCDNVEMAIKHNLVTVEEMQSVEMDFICDGSITSSRKLPEEPVESSKAEVAELLNETDVLDCTLSENPETVSSSENSTFLILKPSGGTNAETETENEVVKVVEKILGQVVTAVKPILSLNSSTVLKDHSYSQDSPAEKMLPKQPQPLIVGTDDGSHIAEKEIAILEPLQSETSDSEVELLSHNAEQHQTSHDDKFQCEICGHMFNEERQLNTHIRTAHKPIFSCETCGKSFTKIQSLRMHGIAAHTGKRAVRKNGNNPLALKNQRKQRVPEKSKKRSTYECIECRRKFATAAVYIRHVSTHQTRSRRSSVRAKFQIKMSSLSFKEEKYICDICLLPFRRAGDLREHTTSYHTEMVVARKSKGATSSHAMSFQKEHGALDSLQSKPVVVLKKIELVEKNNNIVKDMEIDDEHLAEANCAVYDASSYDTHSTSPASVHHFCAKCSMSFNSLSDFVQHKQLHPSLFNCAECQGSYQFESEFLSHACTL